MTKVIAINSSSRSDKKSKTKLMLNHLIKGMEKAGADVDLVNLRDKKIKYCAGCFSCWTKTPGKCVLKDDMTEEIFSQWKKADMAIYATPLFCHHMNALMSTFQERLLPSVLPFFEFDSDRTVHPERDKRPDFVWMSVCGFPNISEFETFSNYNKRSSNKKLIAEIYRAAAESMVDPKYKQTLQNILDATELAGIELIQSRKISQNTLNTITQPLDDQKTIAQEVNMHWQEQISG
ncbi:flavodoxin family protein [Maridesulfovibrio sp.]|uniref:flavodoxin family protein n=1 Tax=Maridesulfovibrio sp. TaxID=2795000 RepID=UPI0029F54D1C|nr:flavodoxin family protein [Maridesulfovibrio sp.]